MERYFTKDITLVCEKLKRTFLIRPSICLGLNGLKRIDRFLLPDSTYGEYLFHVRDVPTYYCNAFDPMIDGTILKNWIDEQKRKEGYIEDKLIVLLKEAGISKVSACQCKNSFTFFVGKEYSKKYEILEIRDIKISD